ncbi:type IX secretion system outer membrane channel protein PorV [Pedobacter changchengzhani]|uniref:Type IX secretion system outer membrane channel protein PorV n=1 Tax=Pedobacter changchengzhani TaxID=2529274 RepID=A0A4R5MPH7_9SPHI|nr:type IX secretion system outer membrane channel protein PorV [Pedobacter changchengzhani]TDG37235.1 type IX secretion system outer membrane channel protein PorV [Pedobacter changchengzhani]
MNLKCAHQLAFSMFSILLWGGQTYGQSSTQTNGTETNNIITAVPFLLITPDARTAAMGDAGVAVSGDVNSASNNPAKLAFLDQPYGFSLSYSPWLKSLIPDINLAYVSGFYKLDDRNTIAASLRYFSLGQIQLTDNSQQDLGIASPSELAFDVSFARKFGNEFSLGSSLRYIYSNLTSGQVSAGIANSGGQTVAVDVSGLYKTETILFGKSAILAAGANLSNIGPKLSYANGKKAYFLPTNLKLGGSSTINIDDFNQFTFALDFNKLLVPTQPIYDSNNNIVSGKDPDRSVPAGIFGSFSDAPGGAKEEFREVGISTGIEYWYSQQFALRGGYNYQSPQKGDSRYITLGAGLKYNVFNIDFAYLIANTQTSPLANTLRFSLLFNFGDKNIARK